MTTSQASKSLIVDAQIHIWAQGSPLPQHRQTSVSAEEMLIEMDEAGVDAAIIHPPISWDPSSNTLAVDAARRFPDRFAIMGQFAPDKPENRALIADWKSQVGMLGLRFGLIVPEQINWHIDGTLEWLFAEAERHAVPIALLAGRFLPVVGEIAARYPRLRLIVDHLGVARGQQDDAAFANLPDLVSLARFPNVAVKATGAPAYSSQPYPYRNIHDALHRICDAFGPRRFFWGTDITRMPCSYRQCVTMFTEEMPWLSGNALDLVMGHAACDWLGWDLPARLARNSDRPVAAKRPSGRQAID
jgi:predicted TIM-barrel fold metal-dependent hydrolase